jgi:hypothetical protein
MTDAKVAAADLDELAEHRGPDAPAIAAALEWLLNRTGLPVALLLVPGPGAGSWSVVTAAASADDLRHANGLAHEISDHLGALMAEALEREPPAGQG